MKNKFITNFLVSGPKVTDFIDNTIDNNQLHYETYLRSIVANMDLAYPEKEIILGEQSRLEQPWHYHYSGSNIFVDYSTFYFTLKKVELEAATILHVQEQGNALLRLYSYASIILYINGKKVTSINPPCYKPIKSQDFHVHLNKGDNQLYLSLQNLGVRDTRTLFGIEILKSDETIHIQTPDKENTQVFDEDAACLNALSIQGYSLIFNTPSKKEYHIGYDNESIDFEEQKNQITWNTIPINTQTYTIQKGFHSILIKRGALSRKFVIVEEEKPCYTGIKKTKANLLAYLERTAKIESLNRGTFGFSIQHILARKYLGITSIKEQSNLANTLQQINDRYDCSDFVLIALIRYLHCYEIDPIFKAQAKEVILNFRYWMTFKGSDAMCFWSENHSLQFYSCAYLAGLLYKDSYFSRAEMTGINLTKWAKIKLNAWFDRIKEEGFVEFLSAGYMCVTSASLLDLFDFGEDDIAQRAQKTLNKIMQMLSIHTFKGSLIAPMGRVYGDVILPYTQGVQTLLNLINPTNPVGDEGWLSCFATTKYKFEDTLKDLMIKPTTQIYHTGEAVIHIEKTADYLLTSVESKREDGKAKKKNLTFIDDCDTSSHDYVYSLNERFHGTTYFAPGVYGYQQHMFVVGLDNDTVVFSNHPGATFEDSSMRPGYWYGNGIMPAIKQNSGCIGAIYNINDNYPVRFTHIYFPSQKMDTYEISTDNHWIFGKKNNTNIAIYCSGVLEQYNDKREGCEWRCYDTAVGYLFYVNNKNYDEFKKEVMHKKPQYQKDSHTLSDNTGFNLTYQFYADETQYL